MASSRVMSTTSPANPDLLRQSSIHSLHGDHSKSFGSMNMDELLRNIYGDADAFPDSADETGVAGGVDGGGGVSQEPEMTLEDFLTKAGAVSEEDVRIPAVPQPPLRFVTDSILNSAQFQANPSGPGGYGVDSVGFGGEIEGGMVAVVSAGSGGGGGGGRGKRKAVEEPQMDKATQQKQRRMIKNRESAARSRERKQAYTVELEALVTQLEEENARLLREEAEHSKERFKQLMENLIPVVEQRKPPRSLRRMHSMCW
ncbi:bZIP transcription factor 12-like isoform X1 [Actinidia eriantha]|uniref:bZIP transcription factor 12-like isoform X1 n=1 Tax=Actinidia eriantha TaxID=165200 RepID=UPI00258623D1|nr:bZIP transcription factor 12-like isoform X1 [Actinidia eriantha]